MSSPPRAGLAPKSMQTATTVSERASLDDIGQQLEKHAGHRSTTASFPADSEAEVAQSAPPAEKDHGYLAEEEAELEEVAEESLSKKTPDTTKSATKAPRRFKAEPVETTRKTHHTKDGNDGDIDKPKPKRRFAPQPVETSEKTSRRVRSDQGSKQSEGKRRFTPEPVEVETQRRRGQRSDTDETPKPSRRKFAPQPVESSTRTRRKASSGDEFEDTPISRQSTGGSSTGRKFSPELLETARGSFRKESSRSSRCPTTDQPQAPEITTDHFPDHSEDAPVHESRFSAANLARKQSRQHSFVVPELPCIDSDYSGEDSALHSQSESASGTPDESFHPHRRGHRQRRDGPYRTQALSEAAEKAEKQLREQALAAFPNEQIHHHVHHFAREESDEDLIPGKLAVDNGMDPKILRRESAADLGIEMEQMQKHHEQLESAKKELKEDTAGQSRFSAAALSARHRSFVKKVGGPSQRGVGLTEMRNAASPPMAGADLVFPQSEEPKTSIPGVGQFGVPKNKEDEIERVVEDQTMWSAGVTVNKSPDRGLWMGCCHQKSHDEKQPPTPLRSGLMTPAVMDEKPVVENNAGRQEAGSKFLHPLTPQNSQNSSTFADSVSKRLKEELTLEQEIESEFDSAFVTQIYNYLSLGYPSVARDFDEELSKISLVSVEDLRADDHRTDAKGYVDAPEGVGLDQEAATEGKCARWTALKLYIHEWVLQQPVMAERKHGTWGVRERRGSWAV